jgi:ferredoxin-NADP reductase
MEEYQVRIIDIEPLTHNVKRFRMEKPEGYSFIPGQATEVSIAAAPWREEKRPFTFTCLNTDPYLEFSIKIYSDHQGVTHELGKLKAGDYLIVRDVWGAISYKGQGTFIAGGAGITPFIAIFRDLYEKHELEGNQLIFANRTNADIILEQELNMMLGNAFINILSDENIACRYFGIVDEAFLKRHVEKHDKNFYVCGPPPMMDAVLKNLDKLGYSKELVTIEI